MLRPETFQQAFVALQHIPYLCKDGSATEDPLSGGVLGRGQVVWTQKTPETKARPLSVVAFADGVGVVSLNPRWLVPADALADRGVNSASQS